jgi:hypothetical protein
MLFLGAFGMPSLAQDANGARTKCTEFGFKENTKSHEECVKQFLNSMGSAKTPSVKKPISTPPESTSTDDQKEDDYWKEAKSVGNKEAFEAYLKFYPRGRYVGLANARISQLNKLDSEKVKTDQLPNENPTKLSCVSKLPYKDWTNCVGTFYFQAENKWKGDKYVGEFRDGNFNGQGTYFHLADNQWKGDKYVGEFRDGKQTGQGTLYALAENQWKGDKYVGGFKDGNFNGQGTYTHSSGNKYFGEHRDGLRNGQGTYFHLADNQWKGDKYVGEFRDGKQAGQGTYTHSNGNKYVGEYRDGLRNGQGTFFYLANDQWKGYKFVGEFRDEQRNGQGTVYGPSGNVIYSGNFLGDKAAP